MLLMTMMTVGTELTSTLEVWIGSSYPVGNTCRVCLWLLQSQHKGDVADEQKSPSAIHRQAITRFHRCGSAKFPKLEDCAHFHYDFVSIGSIQVTLQ